MSCKHETDNAYSIWSVPGCAIGSEWMITAFTDKNIVIYQAFWKRGWTWSAPVSSDQQTRTLQEFHTTRTKLKNTQWLMLCAFGIFAVFVFIEH